MARTPATLAIRAARVTGVDGGYPCNARATRNTSHALHIAMRCVMDRSRAGESRGTSRKSTMPAIIASSPEMQPSASAPNATPATSPGAKDSGRWKLATSATTAQLQNTMGKCTSTGCTGCPNNLMSADQHELGREQRDESRDREQRMTHDEPRRQRATSQMRTQQHEPTERRDDEKSQRDGRRSLHARLDDREQQDDESRRCEQAMQHRERRSRQRGLSEMRDGHRQARHRCDCKQQNRDSVHFDLQGAKLRDASKMRRAVRMFPSSSRGL